MKFINRSKELNFLEKKWDEKKSHFIIIYGKRRVGKTELIKHFIKGKSAVYFLADKRTVLEQLKEMGKLFGIHFNDSILEKQGFGEWLDVFKYISEKTKEQFIFIVDEYPYLVEVDKSMSSVFQKGFDEYLKNENVFLILSGSSISMMESETLIYKAPLYGRRTGQILIEPMSFKESWKFFPNKNFDEFLSIYSVVGGMPAYLLQMDPNLSWKENIKSKIFPKTEFLHNEVEFILKEEFREPKNYFSILKAISFGKRKFSEIINETGLERNILTKYLNVLEKLKIIEKEVPVTEENPAKSKKGLYYISDNFIGFWFQYIFPYKSDLEIERHSEIMKKINESFKNLEALVYEKVCRELTWEFMGKIFDFERVGKWWDKNQEIDVVALNRQTKEILFGEVKWSEKPIGTNILDELKNKSKTVKYFENGRKEYFILFSKSGFTDDLLKSAKKENIFLVHKDKSFY
ncbi:MAG: ATP-binding protein, partial [Elusimicrobia bacterium]|nr:ATP-binding protein [Elusimicrobiota bacterium]